MKFTKFITVVLFGSCSWLSLNSIWMELPLLVYHLVEKWTLTSYLDIIIQIACIFPLFLSIIWRSLKCFRSFQSFLIVILLICFLLIQILLIFFWQKTEFIFGAERSFWLFLLTFFIAFISSSSNLIFMPYIAKFHSSYLTAYFFGMGFSSFLPSVVSFIQAIKCDKSETRKSLLHSLFSIEVFQSLIFLWLCFGTTAFIVLNWFPNLLSKQDDDDVFYEPEQNNSTDIVPNIIIFFTMPYSSDTFHFALTLGGAAQSIACVLPLWVKFNSTRYIGCLTILSMIICAYMFFLSLQSPNLILKENFLGSFLSILISIFSYAINAYLRTLITINLRDEMQIKVSNKMLSLEKQKDLIESCLFWCGIIMQIGSIIGALIMFPLVNYFKLFQISDYC